MIATIEGDDENGYTAYLGDVISGRITKPPSHGGFFCLCLCKPPNFKVYINSRKFVIVLTFCYHFVTCRKCGNKIFLIFGKTATMIASYRFVFNRKKRLDKNGRAPLELRVYIGGKNYYLSTGIKLLPSEWKPTEAKVVRHDSRLEYNAYLSQLVSSLEKYELKLIQREEKVTFQKLRDYVKGGADLTFLDFIQKCLDEDPWYAAKKHHYTLLRALKDFGGIIDFSDLTAENIEKFDRFLRGYKAPKAIKPITAQSTIHSYHRRLKTYINRAIRYDHMDKSPYLKFKVSKGPEKDIRYLTREELTKIEQKDFPIERLDQVRDVFIFSCYTGLPYQKIEELTSDNIKVYDGQEWIEGSRGNKGGTDYQIPLLPVAKKILRKWKNNLPVISNQRTNAYLKEIQTLCGIDTNLTFHMARHTFATTVTLEQGIPLETVSKMLGHSQIRTTQHYSKVRREKIQRDMKRLSF
jgi:integrase